MRVHPPRFPFRRTYSAFSSPITKFTRTRYRVHIFRLRALLHPGHQHCISLGHSLIQLLPSNDPQKLELCNLIRNTVAVVDPYGARLTLYAAITLRELADCPGQDKKEHLSKAMALLMPEPAKSPGAKLLRLIKSELEYL